MNLSQGREKKNLNCLKINPNTQKNMPPNEYDALTVEYS